MSSSEFKVLLIAPWGYPPSWRDAKYCLKSVKVGNISLKGCCIGCSSSIAVYLILKSHKKINNTRLLVIGTDTVIEPNNDDLRSNIKEWFSTVGEKLLNTTSCEGVIKNNEWINDLHFGIVPGIGEYYGYYFKGDILKIFLESYRFIALNIKDFNPSLLILDTTHGLNILTIAVLYATVAASIVYNKRILTINSEPYPSGKGTKYCIEVKKKSNKSITKENEMPKLNIHDISHLQQIIDFLRALNSLRFLNEKQLNRLPRRKMQNKYVELIDKIICMVEALRTGLIGLLFGNSKLSSDKGIPFTINEIYKFMENIHKLNYDMEWFKPSLENNIVKYEPTIDENIIKYAPILDFLRNYIEEYSDCLKTISLKEFAKCLENKLERSGYWDRKQIIINETSNLTEIACEIKNDMGIETIDSNLLLEYWSKKKGFGNSQGEKDKLVNPRNFAAHAALNFNILKSIKVQNINGKCEIVEIIYDQDKLAKILEKIGRKSRLYHCIEHYT